LNHKLETFAHLSKEDRIALDRVTSGAVRDVGARRDLIREGERPIAIPVLLDGWACRYKTLADGRRQILAFLVPGDLCELNIYLLNRMDHAIGAITAARFALIDRRSLERLMAGNPRVAEALWWNALVDAAIAREWMVNVGQRTAYERIAHLICETFIRVATVGLAEGNSCPFPITQVDIGDATGLTPVHVNRMLQELRQDGLIELRARRLVIPELERLKEVAFFNDAYLHLGRLGAHLDAND
jgi:CRP-like cAMP-binding protein